MKSTYRMGLAPENHDPDNFFPLLEDFYRNRKAKIFLHRSGKRYFDKKGFFKNQDIYYVRSSSQMEEAATLTNDLTKDTTFLDGAIFFMIATSIYMGFKELYLCGCGYTYQPLQSGHFYENWTQLDEAPVNHRHRIMKDFADKHGVKIYNVVPDGFESPVYEKISWNQIIL